MRLFLDTEFMEDGRTVELVSIGLVADNGQEFYRQNAQADLRQGNEFVQENVVPQLWPCPKKIPGPRHVYGLCPDPTCVWRPKRLIRDELLTWVREQSATGVGDTPEFWGYYADYDWVVLCQLFGRMIDLPTGWPKYCRDIKQLCDELGNPPLPKGTEEHNALGDARWTQAAWYYLKQYELALSPRQREELILAGNQANQESRLREAAPVLRGRVGPVPEGPADPDGNQRGGATGQGPEAEEAGVVITVDDYNKALDSEVTDAGVC